jgi:Domain of unknown function (DU1801)
VAAAKARTAAQSKTREAASPAKQIASFLAKYNPEVASDAKASRAKMQTRVPGGFEFVYDNYNALVFGYGPTERPSEAVLSLAVMPQWVTLCFLKGARLPDPKKLLRGSGNIVRNIRLQSPADLDEREVSSFITQSIAAATPPFPPEGGRQQTVIKSISTKQRPRRPGSGARHNK